MFQAFSSKWDLVNLSARFFYFFLRHWLITRNPIDGNHTEDFLTSLKMLSRWTGNTSINAPIWALSTRLYMRIYIFLLHIAMYILWIWCPRITVPRSIPFEVRAPISFYEKTCGKGSNIIEAISISEIARDICPFSPDDQRRVP